ncbi:MAG: peptidylprolyl isomerase [Acidimicrobiia bacterium]|nr:peptidylprolyl isomerase [Acidimicrobiia bacterium]
MKRFLALSAVLALTLAACGGGNAATVDGRPITTDDVAALYIDNNAIETAVFTDALYSLILNDIITNAAVDEFSLSVSDEELAGEIADLESEFALQGSSVADELEQRNLSQTYLDVFGAQAVLQDKIGQELVAGAADPTDDELLALFDAQLQSRAQVCARHILVATVEEAAAVTERLDGGEEFGDLAVELSVDTGSGANGGELGCSAPAAYVPEFAIATLDAPIGEPYGPVQSEFGQHIIIVDERTLPEFADVRDELAEQSRAAGLQTLVTEWILRVVRAATVSVASEYGSWVIPEDPTLPPTIEPAP